MSLCPAQVTLCSPFAQRFRLQFSSLLPAKRQLRCLRLRCALGSEKGRESRRLVSVSLAGFLFWFSVPKEAVLAVSGSGLDKYVKRKKLEPLESYVPAVLLAQLQIKQVGKSLEVDQPKYTDCRSLLRSGPAASLRVNIRAVAQYASDDGNGSLAFSKVDQCLRSLEELDSLLLHASRNKQDASVESMKGKTTAAINALDELLKTVPPNVLDQGRTVADAYMERSQEKEDVAPPDMMDPSLKQLESIL
ncbi:unnamed protein product [Cuscuta epithymum]|uniref:DUF7880 domain-containing protein n=1 Tax=Cuscuta epithymum TaxID=186058 RepID=A0AAV0D1Z3_9ASTE|nr:unnamed protein product [Cuscuta epithymum]